MTEISNDDLFVDPNNSRPKEKTEAIQKEELFLEDDSSRFNTPDFVDDHDASQHIENLFENNESDFSIEEYTQLKKKKKEIIALLLAAGVLLITIAILSAMLAFKNQEKDYQFLIGEKYSLNADTLSSKNLLLLKTDISEDHDVIVDVDKEKVTVWEFEHPLDYKQAKKLRKKNWADVYQQLWDSGYIQGTHYKVVSQTRVSDRSLWIVAKVSKNNKDDIVFTLKPVN